MSIRPLKAAKCNKDAPDSLTTLMSVPPVKNCFTSSTPPMPTRPKISLAAKNSHFHVAAIYY
jgi:hypothetical protein